MESVSLTSDDLPEGVKRKRRPPPLHLKPLKAVSLLQPAVADCFSLMEEAGCPAPRCQDDPTTSEAMDELLLPGGGEEEARSDPAGRVRAWLRAGVGGDCWRNMRGFCQRNGLLTLSVIAVVTGCTLGFMLRGTELSTQAKIYFSFPGELLMRMLKMLILPLITSSLMSGLSSMESKACCRMGVLTVTYYLWTTFIAVVVGIVLVLIIKPGTGTEMESNRLGGGPVMTSADALLDLIRNMVPSNLIEATFQQYKTDLIPILRVPTKTIQPNFVYVVPDDNDPKGRTVYLELTPPPDVIYKTSPGSSQQMNVLGIVIFSATMGLLLGRMGERGAPLVNVCQCINECVMKIINAAVWYFPFGIIFLVAGKILDMQDPSTLGKKLGWKNPFSYIRGLLQAMVIALATSSSSATLPITMKCLLENCHVDRQIARFVLPVGATINMDGTALYEAVAAIFIAQVNDYELDLGQLVTISITATAASIGAAGIPQAGLVTMVIVLTSVGLPPDDITLIVAIDWILDRFRTMINVLGDALAAGIIAHLCRKDFPLSETGKAVPSYGTQNRQSNSYSISVPMTEIHSHRLPPGDPPGPHRAHTVYYNICQV
ncbi:PREDICTED: excitatory amino acid transporter 5-like isoform X2 [Poecilia mexicana]|uniref:excitatory amino acid transporter 5-like isoform X2 n=1 Tax=Poecilia mexicana TaxID=48701 RepID=UPI00072DA1F8|nr:PREDICTED: excitatory amino acid transporter 5-like isoform X2 [Poecilia mexicana]